MSHKKVLLNNFFNALMYLKGSVIGRDTEIGLPYNDSLPKCLLQPGIGQTGIRSQKLNLGLPHGWQEH